jgi:hypothetical protein
MLSLETFDWKNNPMTESEAFALGWNHHGGKNLVPY